MLRRFKPTYMYRHYTDIHADFLKKNGYRALLTDLDNTLLGWDHLDSTKELFEWICSLKDAGIQVVVISNNNERRIRRVTDALDIPHVSLALKPLPSGFKKALRLVSCPKDQVVMLGDQIMTDVLGANCYGLDTILVKPLKNSDSWKTKINRMMERKILNYLYDGKINEIWEEGNDES